MPHRVVEIGSYTGLLGIFGHPVRHSLSPRMHNAALAALGLDLIYLAFDVSPPSLPAAIESLRVLRMRGVNVTVPHKEAVVPLLDEVSTLARRVGAVNTIVNDEGRLSGDNTDVAGFVASLQTVLPEGVAGLECLVVGAGGAARSVVAGLVDGGAATVRVYNRTEARARQLCALAAAWGGTRCEAVPESGLREAASTARLLVNATPAGLGGAIKEFALPVDTLHSGQVVVDLVYGVDGTALVRNASRRGAVAIDGREMLLMQAAMAFELWTGVKAPLEVMRTSIERGER